MAIGNRYGVVAFGVGNKGYVGLGIKHSNKDGIDTFMNDFWEYNPDTNTWIRKADFPGGRVGRRLHLLLPIKVM